MTKLLNYIKKRAKAREDYHHLRAMPDRLLADMGIKREELDKLFRN